MVECVATIAAKRPRQDKLIALRLDLALISAVDKIAVGRRSTRSEVVRTLLHNLARDEGLQVRRCA